MRENQYLVGRNTPTANHEQLMNRSLNSGKKRLLRKNFFQLPSGYKIRSFFDPSLKPIFTVLGILVLIGLTNVVFAQSSNQNLQNQINELQQTLSNQKTYLFAVLAGMGVFSVVIIYYFNKSVEVKKKEKELAVEQQLKEMQQAVVEGINEKAAVVNLILDKTSEEQVLLNTKRIYLWGEKNIVNLRKVLRIVGFNMEHLITQDPPDEPYDILFINNEMGSMSPKDDPNKSGPGVKRDFSSIKDVINEHVDRKDVCIFYYNTNQAYLPLHQLDFDLQHRINFATNPSQIYGNLMNSLKYQERLKKEVAR